MRPRDSERRAPRVWCRSTAILLALVYTLVWLCDSVDAAITGATVTPNPLAAGAPSVATVAFMTGIGAPAGGRITVVFPTAFFINAPTLGASPTGITDATIAMGSSTNIIVLTIGTTAVSPGAVSFTVSGVTNPGDGTTSSYIIRIADTTGNTIESLSSVPGSPIAKQDFANAVIFPSTLAAGAPLQLRVSFTTAVAMRVGSILELQFPVLPASTFIITTIQAINHVGLQATSTVTSTAMPYIQLTVAGQDVAANTPISVTFDRLFNPAAQSLAAFPFNIRTRHVAGSIFQETLVGITIANIQSTTLSASATVKPASYLAGVTTTFVVSFPNAAFFVTGAKISVIFPPDFVISGATVAALSNLPTTGTVLSLTATTATVTIGIGSVLPGSNRGFTLAGIINPGSKCGEYIFEYCTMTWPAYTITIRDSGNNKYEESTTVLGTAIVKKPMTFGRVRPVVRQPNVVTAAEVSFTSEVTIPIGGSIEVVFPSSFTVGAPVIASGHVGINTPSTAVAVNGMQVTLTVAGAIPPTAKLVVTFTPITTPDSFATGVYIVRTRDAGTNILEEQDKVAGEACPYLNNCNGHGTCTLFSKLCICDAGWGSASDDAAYRTPDCTLRTCPAGKSWNNVPSDATTSHDLVEECSAMGVCDRSTGKCSCFPGFTGSACERMTCPNNCSGRGKCVSMRELATMKSALPISAPTTYYGGANYATWDADRVFGCACDSSWAVGTGAGEVQVTEYFGGDCSRRHCPSGDDPLTTVIETDCSASGSVRNLCHVECSNRGICNYRTGLCKCFTGFSGFACQTADTFSQK